MPPSSHGEGPRPIPLQPGGSSPEQPRPRLQRRWPRQMVEGAMPHEPMAQLDRKLTLCLASLTMP